MNARAERDVRELELAVLGVEVQLDARQIPGYDDCDEIAEAVANPAGHTQATIVRRSELVGLERRLTSTHAEKEAVRVHLLAGTSRLPEKWPPRSAAGPRQERDDSVDSSCGPHCGRCSPRLLT